MKILGVLITLALMQMSCLADGFYFCFKPACTKTYLKFNQSQMVSHLVKNHKCKKLSANKVKMPNNEVVEIIPDTLSQTIYIQNGWFNYAKNNEDMKLFINAWKLDEKEMARVNGKIIKDNHKSDEPLIIISNMRHCNKCNQEVPVRFFEAHDIDHQRDDMRQYNRTRMRNFMNGGRF
jgi:hypothetical protein